MGLVRRGLLRGPTVPRKTPEPQPAPLTGARSLDCGRGAPEIAGTICILGHESRRPSFDATSQLVKAINEVDSPRTKTSAERRCRKGPKERRQTCRKRQSRRRSRREGTERNPPSWRRPSQRAEATTRRKAGLSPGPGARLLPEILGSCSSESRR